MSSRNQLLKIQIVVELYLEAKRADSGRSNRWILKNVIAPRYPMTEKTLYSYLATPYKKLLKELDAEPINEQLKLF